MDPPADPDLQSSVADMNLHVCVSLPDLHKTHGSVKYIKNTNSLHSHRCFFIIVECDKTTLEIYFTF
jgi:hypothetical protein